MTTQRTDLRKTTRREWLRAAGLAAAGALAGCARIQPAKGRGRARRGRQPNFVLIFADDLGYADLSCYGAEKIRTPNLDRMAAEGLKFTCFYTNAAVCTPSRAGLLTGRYPIRSGLTRVLFPYSQTGIEDGDLTLAGALKRQGYATCCIGKWHLGHLPPHLPTRHGFDRYYGIPYSNDMDNAQRGDPPIPLMRDEAVVEQPADQHTLTRRYTEEAVRFIRDAQDGPFFLYLPHTMPHVPLYVSDAFEGRSAGGLYGDVIEEIDWGAGEILAELERLGLDKNTLVIFTSDNGPWLAKGDHGGSAGPLREGKNTSFEGGFRVPCIARWPGRIAPGRVEDRPASMLDWFPTFVGLAGGVLPAGRVFNGRDVSPVLFGTGLRGSEDFYYYRGETLEAYRSGPWKVKKPFRGNVYGKPFDDPLFLFNLDEDPGETTNLSDRHPEIVTRLLAAMDAFERGLGPVPEVKR